MRSYVSELAAQDQPWSLLFRTGDVVVGLLAVATAAAAWHAGRQASTDRPAGTGRWQVLAWLALATFGLATLVDAGLTPLSCAPSVELACALAERSGTVPLFHQLHTVTSGTAETALRVSMLAMALAPGAGRRARRALFAAMLLTTCLTLTAMLFGSLVGLPQRASLVLASAWLAVVAVGLRRGAL